jgi:hypothetical protein
MSELIIDKITTRDGSMIGAVVVSDLDELLLLNTNKEINTTAIVKDIDRGGVFVYDATQSGVNNDGTIFNGWVRQYDGAVNVKWFGAKGDGIENDVVAIQAAIDTLHTDIYIPCGVYNIEGANDVNSDGISLRSNLNLFGEGESTILRQMGDTMFCVSINQGSSGTVTEADNIRDITVKGLSFTMELTSFREFQHSLNINAATNVLVESCTWVGWRGDAVYIGSSNTSVERHNKNITVRNCYFDGVNKVNRNAVTVIDGYNISITNNYFTRCSRSDMPGAVDIEPNVNTYHIVGNIEVSNNTFSDIGGDTGVICFAIPGIDYAVQPKNFKIINNTIENFGVNRGIYYRYNNTFVGGTPITSNSPSNNLVVSGNTISNGRFPFVIATAKGVSIKDNSFEICTHSAFLKLENEDNLIDVSLTGNSFYKCGTTEDDVAYNRGLYVGNVENFKLTDNSFIDCGRASGGNGVGIDFTGASASSGVILSRNTFSSPLGLMSLAVRKDGGHTFTPSTNVNTDNLLLDGTTSMFEPISSAVWVPTVSGSTLAGVFSYTEHSGEYTRDGEHKVIFANIAWTSSTATGQLYVDLPEDTNTTVGFTNIDITVSGFTLTVGDKVVGLINNSANRIQLYVENAGTLSPLYASSSGALYLNATYV